MMVTGNEMQQIMTVIDALNKTKEYGTADYPVAFEIKAFDLNGDPLGVISVNPHHPDRHYVYYPDGKDSND